MAQGELEEMRGGKRKGSGRKQKPDKKVSYATKIRPELIKRLRQEPNQAKVIEKALCEYLGVDLETLKQ